MSTSTDYHSQIHHGGFWMERRLAWNWTPPKACPALAIGRFLGREVQKKSPKRFFSSLIFTPGFLQNWKNLKKAQGKWFFFRKSCPFFHVRISTFLFFGRRLVFFLPRLGQRCCPRLREISAPSYLTPACAPLKNHAADPQKAQILKLIFLHMFLTKCSQTSPNVVAVWVLWICFGKIRSAKNHVRSPPSRNQRRVFWFRDGRSLTRLW